MNAQRQGNERGISLSLKLPWSKKIFSFCSLLCMLILVSGTVVHGQGLMFLAKKVSADLPADAADKMWESAVSLEIPLASQVMARPRIYESSIKNVTVRALHNSKEIGFLIEWEDATKDSTLDVNKFSDAVALEFPSSSDTGKPHFAMGDTDGSVNIWYWKAGWQETEEESVPAETADTSEKEYSPRFVTDKNYLFLDNFFPAVLASNPVSRPRRPAVENIIAQGYGSATDMEKADQQDLEGKGVWESDRWAVVMKRILPSDDKFSVNFREGVVTPVSFAIWNGSEGNRGGQKVVSTWYYVGLETEEKSTIYVYPAIAFFAALAVEAGIIFWVRKRRAVS